MNQPETIDFTAGEWRLRALFEPAVADLDTQTINDHWFWFVSNPDEDMWLAHAITPEADFNVAAAVVQSVYALGSDIMAAMIHYIGEPWAIISELPISHAQAQRDLLAGMSDETLESLRAMAPDQIRLMRQLDEINIADD